MLAGAFPLEGVIISRPPRAYVRVSVAAHDSAHGPCLNQASSFGLAAGILATLRRFWPKQRNNKVYYI
jgi:hypothetical protein